MVCEQKLKKANEFKWKGFEITLAQHPDDASKLYVVAYDSKKQHRVNLFTECKSIAIEYIRKVHATAKDAVGA